MANTRRGQERAPGPLSEEFDRLHSEHRPQILRYLTRMTRDASVAEELAQETFLRVSRGLDGFRGKSSPVTWIYRIATNACLDHWRRERSRASNPEEAARVGAPLSPGTGQAPALPDRLLEQSEMGDCIRGFIDSLPPDYRAAIILHDLEGLTNPEIANVLGCSLETAKIRTHRGRERLSVLLSEHCRFEYSDQAVLQCDRKPSSEG